MIPIQVHSYYSLLEGTIPIDDILSTAKKYNLHSLTLTDTNGMYGLIDFYKRAKELNIKPILGVKLYDNFTNTRYALFFAKDKEGYKDLCKLITYKRLNEDFNLKIILSQTHNNLVIVSPDIELLNSINIQNDFYGELISGRENKSETRKILKYAAEKSIKLIPSNPVYFLRKNDYTLHKLLRAIDLNTTIDNLEAKDYVDEEFYFKSPKELNTTFNSYRNLIKNIDELVNKCNVQLELGKYHFPTYPRSDLDSFTKFYQIVYNGFERKYPDAGQKEKDRLKYEIEVITSLNYVDYFLVVWDIVQEAKRRGMLYIGRGSAANSMVAYCMDITQIEPISNNLYFERFLNKARSSPPDIDIDFSWKERDEIIKYVFEKYGYDKVAMISTHVTFRARSAFRETAKAFGISDREISTISKKIPWTNAANLPNISKLFPESKSLKFDEEPWKTIVNLASQIANFPRHLSIHPGGIVIAPNKITDYCALEYAKNKGLGLIVTQPDMYGIEDLGLIKLDLLSQRSLGVLRDSLNLIKQHDSI